MNRGARSWKADNWADFLPSTLGYSAGPVDLYAVARYRRIKRLGLRLMIPRGMLVPVERGFEVYLRHHERKDIDLAVAEPSGELTPQQRFCLAHEIAHTLFYNITRTAPTPEGAWNGLELEKTCDRTAGQILIPTGLLKKDIGDYARIDTELVRRIAATYRTSLSVVMRRLNLVEPSNPFDRCILLVHRANGDGHIREAYFGVGMYRTLPRPSAYTRLTEWISELPPSYIRRDAGPNWSTKRMGRNVVFEKTELDSGFDFLLQVQVASSAMAQTGTA